MLIAQSDHFRAGPEMTLRLPPLFVRDNPFANGN